MTSVTRAIFAVVMLALMSGAYAETSKTINFENQREENFDLENWLKETRHKTETVDSTCYRQEPYVENVCRDVTKYRQQCHMEPSRQECRTEYERVCRIENRYENECHMERGEPSCRVVIRHKQECSSEGGGRQCRTVPGDVVCRRAPNGENRCEKVPPRQVCENEPGRQVCRSVPYEERQCTDGPSRQVCRQVNRPYETCDSRPRQQCRTIPAHEECSQVPYSVKECKDETLYRQIPYACKKDIEVPYEVTLKTHQANVQVLFDAKASTGIASQYNVSLDVKGDLAISGKEVVGNKALAFVKKDVKTTAEGDVNQIKAIYKLALYNKDELFNVAENGISNVDLNKHSLSFVVNGKFDQKRSTLAVKIAKKDDVKFDKTLKGSQFKATFDGSVTTIEVDLQALGAPKLGGVFNKTHNVALKLKVDYSDVGEILLPKLGELSAQTNVEVKVD